MQANRERLMREEERLHTQQARVEKGLFTTMRSSRETQAQQAQQKKAQQEIQHTAEENSSALSQLEAQRAAALGRTEGISSRADAAGDSHNGAEGAAI